MLSPPEPDLTLDQLRQRIAASTEDPARAYWLEILGLRLALQQEHEEALDCLTRAVAIRSGAAPGKDEAMAQLAAVLTNQGQVLSSLSRYGEAIAAHTRALDLYGHLLDRAECLSRYADNAGLLADALHSSGCAIAAARFQGRAVAAFFAGLPIAGGPEDDRVLEAVGRLGALLDAVPDHHGASGCSLCSDERLLESSRPSAYTAAVLSHVAFRLHLDREDALAVRSAARAVAYCDLFDSTGPEIFAVLVGNLLAIASWSIALGGGSAAIHAAGRAAALGVSHPFLLPDPAMAAASQYIAGVLHAPEDLAAAHRHLSAAADAFDGVLALDPAKYTPRLAEALFASAVVLSATGHAHESAEKVDRASALWRHIRDNPHKFDADAGAARERLHFLAAAVARDASVVTSSMAELDTMLPPAHSAESQSEGAPDRRLWCCTGRDFVRLVGDLAGRHIASSDVHTLGSQLRILQLYPARDFAYRCQPRPPDVFLSYNWSTNFVDLQGAVHRALQYLGGVIGRARPDLTHDDIERLVLDHIGIWVDFVFIDQSARDVVSEVREVVPAVIDASDVHFVLSPTALTRSWCCYELALFNRRGRTEALGQRTMRSFVEPPATKYTTFASTSTSAAGDKSIIEQYLKDEYPGGPHALDALLIQASMLSYPFVVEGFAQFAAAEQLVLLALDKWIGRLTPPP